MSDGAPSPLFRRSEAPASAPGEGTPVRAALLAGSRYELLVKIATGGTATVYVGRVRSSGTAGFSRLVAIKRAHPHLRDDPAARAALIREARLASRVHHANVVPIQDVEETEDELLLVMDYIEGGSLSELLDQSAGRVPAAIALRVLLDAGAGLAAVHALTDDTGRDVGMVHRDVSPQNILVGVDGTARLTDFGLARLTEVSGSVTATVKGKIAYMAPEYIEGAAPTRRCDVFSMGVVVWEALAGRRLFRGNNDADTLRRVVSQPVPRLSSVVDVPAPFDAVLARALSKDPRARYRTIHDMLAALNDVAALIGVASAQDVGKFVSGLVGASLARRRETVRMMADPDNATGSMLLGDLPIDDVDSELNAPTVRLRDGEDVTDVAVPDESGTPPSTSHTSEAPLPTTAVNPVAAVPPASASDTGAFASPPRRRQRFTLVLVPLLAAGAGVAVWGLSDAPETSASVVDQPRLDARSDAPSHATASAHIASPPESGAVPDARSARADVSATPAPSSLPAASASSRVVKPSPRRAPPAPALPDNPYRNRGER